MDTEASAQSQQKKTVNIFVNGTEKTTEKDEICYAEAVMLAGFPVPIPAGTTYAVSYSKAEGNKQGTLSDGGKCVKAKEGMEIRVDTGTRS